MSQLTRSTKVGGSTILQANTLARAVDLETDMLALFNAHNNHDTGTSKWQVGSFENATSTVLIANNSTGTNNIAEFRDNGTAVVTVQDGGTLVVAPASATGKGVVANSGTSTGNVLEIQDNGGIVLQVADGGATTVKATDGGSTVALTVNNGTSTGHIAAFQDNGTNAWHIADGGSLVSNSKKITGLAAGTTAGDSIRYEQVVLAAGSTMTGNLAFNPTTAGITGTTTNDAAAAGVVGQYIESVVSAVSFAATSVWSDATFISLTAGDWDVTGVMLFSGVASVTSWGIGISATSGNNTTGLTLGSNYYATMVAPTATNLGSSIPSYRVSISSTTTYYFKFRCDYSGSAPTCYARLSARRMR